MQLAKPDPVCFRTPFAFAGYLSRVIKQETSRDSRFKT